MFVHYKIEPPNDTLLHILNWEFYAHEFSLLLSFMAWKVPLSQVCTWNTLNQPEPQTIAFLWISDSDLKLFIQRAKKKRNKNKHLGRLRRYTGNRIIGRVNAKDESFHVSPPLFKREVFLWFPFTLLDVVDTPKWDIQWNARKWPLFRVLCVIYEFILLYWDGRQKCMW